MLIRIWRKNAILCDLEVDESGFGTWHTRPNMPDNNNATPDLQIDPWAKLVRVGTEDAEQYGKGSELDRLRDALQAAENGQCGCLSTSLFDELAP